MRLPLACLLTVLAAHASAQQEQDATKASLTLSRHHTSNALDSPLALRDWYSQLRGSVDRTLPHDLGSTRIAGEVELRLFDTYAIENDAAGGLSVATTIRASQTLELRGTLSLGLVSEGDDIAVGDFILGMRTRRATFAAGLQAGLRLSPDTVLVIDGSASHERPSATRFQEGVLPPLRLESPRDRMRLVATLTRTKDSFGYGVFAAAGMQRTEPIGILPELRMAEAGARLHGRIANQSGASLAASAGVETLRLMDGPFRQTRLAYDVAGEAPLPMGFSLRGALKAGYDLSSRDDPLAVWVVRYQAEAGYRPIASLHFGTGIYIEQRNNIGLGTRENQRGIYGEAIWQALERIAVNVRLDATKRALEGSEFERRAIDVQLGLTARL